MFSMVKKYFNKPVQEEIELKMMGIVRRNAYEAEKDELILIVREDFSKDICKLLNKENDRDKYFYQIIDEDYIDFDSLGLGGK